MSTNKSLTTILVDFKEFLKDLVNVTNHLDTEAAATSIKDNMEFKGPNVWILAISVIIASVGLNVNSTAVIIGAMLISPLMGPIYATGLSLGTNDTQLLKEALKNFAIMVVIALVASFLYFKISPLKLANPTELMARTRPTLYDVIIALAGGIIGIFEVCRKQNERGTVISGVAIATALMPPLCTVGYGLAKGGWSYIWGAGFLFCINFVFIATATYIMVNLFDFPVIDNGDERKSQKLQRFIAVIVIIVAMASGLTAFHEIRYNNFENKVNEFVKANRTIDNVFIYDAITERKDNGFVTIHVTGGTLKTDTRKAMIESAVSFGIKETQIAIKEHSFDSEDDISEILMQGIYDRTDAELNRKEMRIRELEAELSAIKEAEIPYMQIAREIKSQYPEIESVSLSNGAEVGVDSLGAQRHIIAIANSKKTLTNDQIDKLSSWLKIRLNDTTVVVINHKTNGK